MKLYKYFLPVATFFLLILNLVVFGFFGDTVSQIVRFISMGMFFLIFLSPKYFKKSALVIFSAFLVSDFLLINYESTFNQNLILFIRLCAFLLLARLVQPYLKKIRIEIFQATIFGVILILNVLLLHYADETINVGRKPGFLEEILLYGYGLAAIISVSVAFTFYNRYTDNSSVFYLLAVIGLIMSDFTYFIGFFLGFREFYYLDRAFNIMAIGSLLHFVFLFKNSIAKGSYSKEQEIF